MYLDDKELKIGYLLLIVGVLSLCIGIAIAYGIATALVMFGGISMLIGVIFIITMS